MIVVVVGYWVVCNAFYRKINWLISFTHYTYHLRQKFHDTFLSSSRRWLTIPFEAALAGWLVLLLRSINVCLRLIGLTLARLWRKREREWTAVRKHRTTSSSHNSRPPNDEQRWFVFSNMWYTFFKTDDLLLFKNFLIWLAICHINIWLP